jgi:hypothetical protein
VSVPTRSCFLLLYLLLLKVSGWSQPIVVSGMSGQPVGLKSEYFLDKSRSLTISDINSASGKFKFQRAHEETLNFGPTLSACWVRFSYVNRDTLQRFLTIGNTNLNEVDVFVMKDNRIVSSQQAGLTRTSARTARDLNLNTWLFELPNSEIEKSITVYIRVADPRRVILPMQIKTLDEVIRTSHHEDFLFGLYFGCLGIIAILNLYFFIYFKESIYVFY